MTKLRLLLADFTQWSIIIVALWSNCCTAPSHTRRSIPDHAASEFEMQREDARVYPSAIGVAGARRVDLALLLMSLPCVTPYHLAFESSFKVFPRRVKLHSRLFKNGVRPVLVVNSIAHYVTTMRILLGSLLPLTQVVAAIVFRPVYLCPRW
jgi:hypothetical protein